MRTEMGLAWAGLRHRPGPWWLLGLGVVLATAMPIVAAGLQTASSVAAVSAAVAALPEPTRGVLAVTSRDVRGTELRDLDAQVTTGLLAAGLPQPQRVLAFRTLSVRSNDVTVAAADRLADDIVLVSGRLPSRCSPTACEVLAVIPPSGGRAPDAAGARDVGLVVTGVARLRESRFAGLGLVEGGQPLLLGGDPAAMTELSALTSYGRNLAWFAPLDARAVTARGTAAFSRALGDLSAEVDLGAGPLNVVWPSDDVLAATERADASAVRFAVLGAGAGALQLGFCLVLAAGSRRGRQQYGALLARRGARPGQVLQVSLWQPSAVVVAGIVVGAGVGAVAVAGLTAGLLDRPQVAVAATLARTWPTVASLGLAAVVLTVVLARWADVGARGVRLALGSVVLVLGGLAVLALVAPVADPAAPLPIAALVCLVVAVGLVATLAWSAAAALVGRMPDGRGLRAVVRQARRRPLLPSVTAGFLAAALATALLAGGYAATLLRSAQDRAAAVVPLDVRVTSSAQVALPASVLDVAALTAVAPDVAVSDVISTPVTAFTGSILSTALPLTGIDPDVLKDLHAFAAVTGSDVPAAEVADRLRTTPPAVAAPVVPAGAPEVRFAVGGLEKDVAVSLWLASVDGQEQPVAMTRSGDELVAALPAGPAHTVRALEITELPDAETHRQHAIGEGTTDRPLPTGTLRLGPPQVVGATAAWAWSGWGADQAQVSVTAESLTVGYRIVDHRVVVVPGWAPPATRSPIPVAVDPATAARAGSRAAFGITVNGTTQPVRIAAVLPRMATLPTSFVLADRAAVSALVDRTAPGSAPVSQVWIRAPGTATVGVRAVLSADPAAAATVQYRTDLAAAYAADPVATGFATLLGVAGAAALLLSLVAVAGGIRSDRTGSAADLFALELDGVPPRRLRRVLAARAGLVLLVGVPVGLLGGVGLTAAAVRLLGTGPDGRPVVPPLRVVLASVPTGLVVLAAVVGVTVVVLVVAGAALRGTRLRGPETDLR